MNPKDAYELFNNIFQSYSYFYGITFGILILLFVLLYSYLKKSFEAFADRHFNKSLEEFKKNLDITFRDESIRSELTTYFSTKSIEMKLNIYEEVYRLYFDYQKSWSYNAKTPEEDILKLQSEILQMRQRIFLNSIYLGGYLTENLLQAVISMMESLEYKVRGIHSPLMVDIEEKRNMYKMAREATDYINRSEKWIVDYLGSDKTIKMFDLKPDQLERLKSETIF